MESPSGPRSESPQPRLPGAGSGPPTRWRWNPVLAVGVLTALVAAVLVVAWLWQPENDPTGPPIPDPDPVTGHPMFNRSAAVGGGWEVAVWTEGRVLMPSSTISVVIDLMPPAGEPPVGTIRVAYTGNNGRTGAGDFDLAGRAVQRAGPDGRAVYRVRLENPVPGFPSQGGFGPAVLSVRVHAGPGAELKYEGTLAFDVIRRH